MRIVLSLFLLLTSLHAQSEGVVDSSLKRRYQDIKSGILSKEEEKRKVLSELFKVTSGMKKINKRKERLMNEKYFVEEKIVETSKILEKVGTDLGDLRNQLRARLRSLYKFSGQNSMRMIFSSQTPSELDRNLKIIKIVADKDYKLIRRYEKNLKRHAIYSKKLNNHKKHMLNIESEIKTHEKQLLAQQDQKNKIVEGLDKETFKEIMKLERVRTESRGLAQRESAQDFKRIFFELRGRLPLPVQGVLVQSYGNILDKKYRTTTRFKGHFYKTVKSEPVQSVFDGDVVFSNSVFGLGPTVVVSHGDHYYTVYGNHAENNVRVGDRVKTGDVVGRTGSQYFSLGIGSYFEVRHFSEPLDPIEWIQSEENYQISMFDEKTL